MSPQDIVVIDAVVVEQDLSFTLTELCQACGSSHEQVLELVDEGVLGPQGSGPADWVFDGESLKKARAALRLTRDLDLGPSGAALVLDLLAEVESLRSRLRQAGLL